MSMEITGKIPSSYSTIRANGFKQNENSYVTAPACSNTKPIPLFAHKSVYLVSFGYDFKLKSEENLPCPCCGKTMSTYEEVKQFGKEMTTAKGEEIIKNIEKYEDRLPEVDRTITNLLKIEAENSPDLTINKLLIKIKKEPKSKLEQKQKNDLNDMKDISEQLYGETYNIMQKDLSALEAIIKYGKNGKPFKRKTLLNGINKVISQEQNADNIAILNKIYEKALDMPTSGNDSNAFIVKYSKRSASEIAERIISPSQATAEHVHPRSKNGHDGAANFLSECQKCNNDRKNMSYVDWLKIHPEMKDNAQIYIDEVIKRINSGKIKNFDFYPWAIKKAVYDESGGIINLDISKSEYIKPDPQNGPKVINLKKS